MLLNFQQSMDISLISIWEDSKSVGRDRDRLVLYTALDDVIQAGRHIHLGGLKIGNSPATGSNAIDPVNIPLQGTLCWLGHRIHFSGSSWIEVFSIFIFSWLSPATWILTNQTICLLTILKNSRTFIFLIINSYFTTTCKVSALQYAL